jgi:type I restriction enzyme, S subunit
MIADASTSLSTGLKPYPEYRHSSQTWFGNVPQHWSVLPNRGLFSEVKDRNHSGEEMLSVTIKRGIVLQKTLLADSSKKDTSNLDRSAYKLVQPSDIAYNKMRAWQGAIGVSNFRGIISPAYVVMRMRTTNNLPRYFHHLYRTPQFAKEAERWSYGITSDMWSLRPEHFKMIYTPEPPTEEQAAIVRFLDWGNNRLERAIRAKRKVIALLNEQKQAIIQRAVTRGLDPSVPLKPSGIPWLGDVPAQWEVRRLKHCITSLEQGWSPQCDAQPADENEWGVLKVGCVNKESFSEKQNKKLPESLAPDPRLEIKDIDILVSRANTRELLGLAALAENPRPKLILCDKLFRFRARSEFFNSKFLVQVLRAKPSRSQIESSTNGASSSMQNIGQGVLKNLWISMPPVAEQEQIIVHIASESASLNITISRLEHEIELLREYRARLVADVVTGKLDVREVAAKLPEEAAPDTEEYVGEAELPDEEVAV